MIAMGPIPSKVMVGIGLTFYISGEYGYGILKKNYGS
jgi:hypothetical protein